MDNKVKIDIVDVNTKKTENSVKSLKARIKELRLEIEGLDESSAEYQQRLTELGNLLHQNAEIQEQAKLYSQDYGDTLSAVTKTTSGLVAGISGVNAVMNLMGASTDEAQQALLKVQSLMAIVQALTTFDEAEKAFNSLWQKLKLIVVARQEEQKETIESTNATNANTTANNKNATSLDNQTKSINKGVKGVSLFTSGLKNLVKGATAFIKANPFTFVVTTLFSLLPLLDKFINKQKEINEQAEKALDNRIATYGSEEYKSNDLSNKEYLDALNERQQKVQQVLDKYRNTTQTITKEQIENDKRIIQYTDEKIASRQKELKQQQNVLNQYTAEQKKVEPYLSERQQFLNEQIKLYDSEIAVLSRKYELESRIMATEKEGSDNYIKAQERAETAETKLNEVLTKVETAYKELDTITETRKGIVDKENENQLKLAKENQDKAKEQLQKHYQEQYNSIKDWLVKEEKLLEEQYKLNEITEKEKYEKQISLYEQYRDKINTIASNPNVSETDLIQNRINVLDNKRVLAEYELQLIEQRKIVAEQMDILVIDEATKLKKDIETYSNQINENNAKIKALENANWIERYNMQQQQNNQSIEEKINYLDRLLVIEENYLTEQQNVLSGNYNRDTAIENETYNKLLESLKFQLNNNLITELQYNNELEIAEKEHKNILLELEREYQLSVLDLDKQRTQLESEYSAERYNIAQEEVNKRMSLNEVYLNSFQTVQSQLSSFLSSIQSQYDSNSKEYKNLAKLQIISDTTSGAMSAFSSGFKSGLPFPYNTILASVLSGLVISEGLISLSNLNQNKIGNSTSTTTAVNSIGSSVYETMSYETMSDLSTSIRDMRVVVLESDISETSRRVSIAESEATF